jgi:hypothetical protein
MAAILWVKKPEGIYPYTGSPSSEKPVTAVTGVTTELGLHPAASVEQVKVTTYRDR